MDSAKPRLVAKIAGQRFDTVIKATIERDLEQISGTYHIEMQDDGRLKAALSTYLGTIPDQKPIAAGDAIRIELDGEPVLVGWVEVIKLTWQADQITCEISGRDKVGDLVECAALPTGPTEFKNVDLRFVARQVCAPFGITVTADVDIGEPFVNLAVFKHQTALAFLEGAARQRAVLLTSDGVGGLLLTRGGQARAPDCLWIGQNVQGIATEFDWRHRFSDYFVQQQSQRVDGGTAPALDHSLPPSLGGAPTGPGPASANEAARIVMQGHAMDPAVTRWRPTVWLTRTQSGMSTVQEQAEWRARLARGQAERIQVQVNDWRAGPKRVLWRPNALTALYDPYAGFDKDMLIAGVRYDYGEHGYAAQLRLAGPTAYDRINESERHRGHHNRGQAQGRLDSSLPTSLGG